MLLLQEDPQERARLRPRTASWRQVRSLVRDGGAAMDHSHYMLAVAIKENSDRLPRSIFPHRPANGLGEKLSRLTMNPWTGLPLLALVLYFGLYQFVGVFGAGTCVGFLEETVFGSTSTPGVDWAAAASFPGRGCATSSAAS